MHDDESDESLATARPPAGGPAQPGIKLPAPGRAKGIAMPGGVPPMFAAGTHVRPPGVRGDALQR
jgi:hypothetical protein